MKLIFPIFIITLNLYSSMVMSQNSRLSDSGISYIHIGKPLMKQDVISRNDRPDKKKYWFDKGYDYFFSNDSILIGEQSMFDEVIAATDSSQKVAGIFITVKRSESFGIEELRQIFGSEQVRSELGIGNQSNHITYYWKTSVGTTIFFTDYLIAQKLNRIEIFSSQGFEERPGIAILDSE